MANVTFNSPRSGNRPPPSGPTQLHLATLGATGCYFLCLLDLAQEVSVKPIDPLAAYLFCRDKGWIGDDCWVKNPEAILSHYTGKTVSVRKEPKGYVALPGEDLIPRYERVVKEPGKETVLGHFVRVLLNGDLWDPYGKSETVAHGSVASVRVVKGLR